MVAMSSRLWLVRHGATDWSDTGRFNGWTDVPLNEQGRLQARSLRERLATMEFAGVWSSDLVRARETARLAVGEPVRDRRLRELDFGSLEGRRWDECPLDVRRSLVAFDGFEAPAGESVEELRSRVLQFVGALPAGQHLLFTHGGVIRLLLREADRDLQVLPGALVRLGERGDRRVGGERSRGPIRTSGR
jgi:2,3-bisphosphoglycerate-dependent phosphoglycerate mutase